MLTPRWLQPAGFGLLILLVGLSWAQTVTSSGCGCAWPFAGGGAGRRLPRHRA